MLLCFNPRVFCWVCCWVLFFFPLIIISITGEDSLHVPKQVTGCLNIKIYHPAQSIGKYSTADQQPPWATDTHPSLTILPTFTEDMNTPIHWSQYEVLHLSLVPFSLSPYTLQCFRHCKRPSETNIHASNIYSYATNAIVSQYT